MNVSNLLYYIVCFNLYFLYYDMLQCIVWYNITLYYIVKSDKLWYDNVDNKITDNIRLKVIM